MPYTSPGSVHTPSSGVAAPSGWGTSVNNAFDWFADDRPRARVYRTTTQSVPSSTNTSILFTAERFDVGGCHSTSSNTSRLTVPAGGSGLYIFGATLHFPLNGTGRRILTVQRNGATFLSSAGAPADGTVGNYMNVVGMYELDAGDYLEIITWQDSGGALNVTANTANSPEFWFAWFANKA